MTKSELRFEQALERLEAVVAKLEAGNASLDEALSLYEEGMELIRQCNAQLDGAQQRIEAVRRTEDGFVTESLE